jgi:hypothetical protein
MAFFLHQQGLHEMSNEIKVGDWTLTATAIRWLNDMHSDACETRGNLEEDAKECCSILGIDPTTDSVARDICEEIVLHGTPVDEVIAKLQRHLEGGQ